MKLISKIPDVLNQDYAVVLRNTLPFSNEILKNAVDNSWQYLSRESIRLAEIVPKN